MSRIVESACKYCRREATKLFLKGDRCYTDKCSFERRAYPPGQHGQSRMKFSEFALQLREKQKTKRYYGVFERQFRKYFQDATKVKGETGLALLQRLETRLDNVVYLLGFAASRREAHQIVKHNHILVNGVRVNLPGFAVSAGDVVEVAEASRQVNKVMAAIESVKRREIPQWLEPDHANYKGRVKDAPGRENIGLDVEENMIVEYYSR
ncbi:MAG: 30S ribosomal protein S4 [Bdellovibrionales bacterium]